MKAELHWACRWCGYSPRNKGWWCDLGCGRDYNEMIEIPLSVARQVAQLEAALATEEERRDKLADMLDLRDREAAALRSALERIAQQRPESFTAFVAREALVARWRVTPDGSAEADIARAAPAGGEDNQ